jgi:hypothetical protein
MTIRVVNPDRGARKAESGNPRQGDIGEVRSYGRARVGLDPVAVSIFGAAACTTAADRSVHATGPDRAGGWAEQLRVRGGGSRGVLGSVRAMCGSCW